MTKNSTKEYYIVAVDDGYAQTKLVGENPNGDGIVKTLLRSSIRPGRNGLGSITGGGISAYETEEGEHFTVSEDIESENTQFDGFHTSPLNRVLVQHALVNAGYAGKRVKLTTGLPVADFFFEDAKDDERIAMKSANLKKGVLSSNVIMPMILDVSVGCQGIAAWYNYVLDDDLNQINEIEGRTAIIDIGGRTTDIATVVNGQAIDHSASSTANIGVLDVYNNLGALIRKEFRVNERFPLPQMDKAVRTGILKLWNKPNDISRLVETVVVEHESKIAREVERRIGSAASFNAVVFVGGGSALFKNIAARFPNGVMPDDPEFANAHGLFKFCRYSQ